MKINDKAQTEIIHRLRRVRGQLDGVIAMIESGRTCRDIVTQLSAASKALDRAGYKLISTSMQEGFLAEAGERELTPEELEALFISLA